MKKWLAIGLLVAVIAFLIFVEVCPSGTMQGEGVLSLPMGYYEQCDCELSVGDRGVLQGFVRDRYACYLFFSVRQDPVHVYVAAMGHGAFYHLTRPAEAPAG